MLLQLQGNPLEVGGGGGGQRWDAAYKFEEWNSEGFSLTLQTPTHLSCLPLLVVLCSVVWLALLPLVRAMTKYADRLESSMMMWKDLH